jgi:sugar O-acyltransferase (sialic acid O-acetyltransferase NeuD family)
VGHGRLRSRADGLFAPRRNLTLLSAAVSAAKKHLIIISAGAFGREVRDIARDIESSSGNGCPWRLGGFLDDRNIAPEGLLVLGSPSSYEPKRDDLFVCAIGDPIQRAKYSAMLRARGGRFAVLIEPSAKIGGQTELAAGSIVGPFCVISCNVKAGEDTVFTSHVTVGHDVRFGNCCHVGACVFLGGGAVVGDKVAIHPHATILPGIRIGDGATVGAGSVVLRSVPAGATVFGVPAMTVAKP